MEDSGWRRLRGAKWFTSSESARGASDGRLLMHRGAARCGPEHLHRLGREANGRKRRGW